MKKILVFILLYAFSVGLMSHEALAQSSSIDGVDISMEPNMPSPGQTVTISLQSYAVDIDASSIVWLVNGKNYNHGTGMRSIELTAPKIGGKTTIQAIIKDSGGREIKKGIVMNSGSIDIIWETDGYTPPFYRGKNPYSYQNKIKLIAIPHISTDGKTEINPQNLVYVWRNNGKYITGDTNISSQSVTISADNLPRPLDISVEVHTKDQKTSITKGVIIEPSKQTSELYEMNSLYGILFNKSLTDNVSLKNNEMNILAIPFGFKYNPSEKNLLFKWSMNGEEKEDLSRNQSITLKTKGDTDGSTDINLSIINPVQILQSADTALRVNYNKVIPETYDQNL